MGSLASNLTLVRIVLRVFIILISLLGLLLAAGVVYGTYLVRKPFPQTSGTIEVNGLSSDVEVVRNQLGIPSIYAESLEDLFFAQGFVHAQDRFWEMDVRRHITAGRLSEMFGASQVTTDTFLRTLGWQRIAEEEVGLLNDRSIRILDAYSAGVNAYLDERTGGGLGLEYSVLALQNPEYKPEPWQPAHSVAWLKALAWDLRGNMNDEIYRAVMASAVGVSETERLFPPYPFETRQPIVTAGMVSGGEFTAPSMPEMSAVTLPADALPTFANVAIQSAGLESLLGPTGPGIGSNSWALNGQHTESGKPLLVNDPHLAPSMPSLWYQSALHCRVQSTDCNYQISGWTMAGLPGVFIGHNDAIAWGFTNMGPDVTDLVLHKVDGETYLLDGERQPLEIREETINVAGGDDVIITIRTTPDGPIISDVPDLDTYNVVGQDAPVPAPGSTSVAGLDPERGDGYAVALRWTALTPRPTFDAFDALNTARNFDDFRQAARYLAVPAQNLLYADTAGNIGYQAPGIIPIRENYDGKWPVPGWSSRYRWSDTVPFESLPSMLNPPRGWIVAANQAVIGPQYQYFLTDDWAYGARSQRIIDRLNEFLADGETVNAEQMRELLMDNHNMLAAFMVPRLPELNVNDNTRQALQLFLDWDFQQDADSAAAAYFNAMWAQLVERMFNAVLPSDVTTSSGSDRFWQVIENIWDSPDDFWWDDRTVPGIQTRDDTLGLAAEAAASQLSEAQGSNPKDWRWGSLHTLEFVNQTLGKSGIAPIEMLFNRGPVEVSGGDSTVNATGWTPSEGFIVDWVPSMRQVIDLSDFDRSTWINLTGNSGHAYNRNYSNQIDAWVAGEQFPWAFTADAIDASAVDRLVLQPRSAGSG
jgi:penicillin amidase